MSYDRYVAICKPLHYTTIISNKICYQLVGSSWLAGFLVIFPPLILGLQLDFCDSNIIDHFTCDSAPLLQISCTDTSTLELLSFVLAVPMFKERGALAMALGALGHTVTGGTS